LLTLGATTSYASSQPEELPQTKHADTGKIVRFTLDAGTPLSPDELTQLAGLKKRALNLSDLPESPADAEWMRFVPEIRKAKQVVSLRLDADVLSFFKGTGKRYQSRINEVLKAYAQAQATK
jgi:uncharacterized protein (DUF4415 family)